MLIIFISKVKLCTLNDFHQHFIDVYKFYPFSSLDKDKHDADDDVKCNYCFISLCKQILDGYIFIDLVRDVTSTNC